MAEAYSYLRPNAFRLAVKELPLVSFTCQSVNLPALTSSSANQPTPFKDLPRTGDKLYNDDLSVSFIMNEDMSNYLELYNWMISINFPKDHSQFASLVNRSSISFSNDLEDKAYSDITLSILDSDNNPRINIMYRNCFPILLNPTPFDIREESVRYVTCDATFKFSMYDIETL